MVLFFGRVFSAKTVRVFSFKCVSGTSGAFRLFCKFHSRLFPSLFPGGIGNLLSRLQRVGRQDVRDDSDKRVVVGFFRLCRGGGPYVWAVVGRFGRITGGDVGTCRVLAAGTIPVETRVELV